ncbi:hypothetical protein [Mucilaginibacter sp.]|jgi:hypothetical protein|uniref:hypothetical protein n=1 Tax=Mucilaginibacter sp. TaxID=1882438 RepID=UPI002D058FF4|nr:hypothetical protein [Mucilaginibacter sp.]HTI59109.1 hypothetical protein [Mucilaginibacter sp.]
MDPEDGIWKGMANKLADEATENELRNLDRLLQQYPGLRGRAERLSEWWQNGKGQQQNEGRLFEEVLKRIKPA